MKIGFLGMTHLGQTLQTASHIRGHETKTDDLWNCDVILVTQDVEDHEDLAALDELMGWAIGIPDHVPLVICSQVPPGYTRKWAKRGENVYYQQDTIIMNSALLRATFPGRIVVGVRDKLVVDRKYWDYLRSFECPIHLMSYESAELSKLAVNYLLAKQIEAVDDLNKVATCVGATWKDMIGGLRADGRLGTYLEHGTVGGHLPRDVKTIRKLLCLMP